MHPDAPEVELLDTRPPRPGRRWRQVLIGVVALAAVGALVVARSGEDGSPASSRPSTRPPLVTTAPAPSSPSVTPGVVNSPAVAFARTGPVVWAVDGDVLITVDWQTGRRREWPATVPPADSYALLTDGAANVLWLVAASESRVVVEAIDPTGGYQTFRRVFRAQFMGAAALYGRLYLGTTAGVSLIGVPGELEPVRPVLGGQPLAMTADPGRGRILATVIKKRSIAIGAWSDGRRRPDVVTTSPIGKGNLVVAGGRIWAAGFGQHAVLVRLAPRTLRVVRHSPLERDLGSGGAIVDSAARHLLVRSGTNTGSDLWCIDATSGAIVRHWGSAPGTAVLTAHGVVLLQPKLPLVHLPSGACRG